MGFFSQYDSQSASDSGCSGSQSSSDDDEVSPAASLVPAKRDKKGGRGDGTPVFLASWLVKYPWLECSVPYQVAEQTVTMQKPGRANAKTGLTTVKKVNYVLAPPEAMWKCRVCSDPTLSQLGALSSNEKLSSTGHRHDTIKRADRFASHGADARHIHLMNVELASLHGNADGIMLPAKLTVTLTTDEELLAGFFVNVYYTARNEGSLMNVEPLRQLSMYHGVQMPLKQTHYQVVEICQAWADVYRDVQEELIIANDDIFGITGDGSADGAGIEWEAMGLCLIGDDGKPNQHFFELEEVDLEASRDNESPDSQALLCTYGNAFQRRLPRLADFMKTGRTWTDCTPGAALDGASVNMGKYEGLKALLETKAPWLVTVHAVAHRVELATAVAFNEVPYYRTDFDSVTREVYSTINKSPKTRANCKKIAEDLDSDRFVSLCRLHGIRWQRALQRAVKAVFTDWRVLCIDFQERGKKQTRQAALSQDSRGKYLRTPVADFKNVTYSRKFQGSGWHTGQIKAVLPTNGNDFDLEEACLKGVYQDKHVEFLHKAELLDLLEADDPELAQNSLYKLYSGVADGQYLCTLGFMIDVRTILAELSELCQRGTLLAADVNLKLEAVRDRIISLQEKPGPTENAISSKFDTERELYRGIAVPHWKDGRKQYLVDRKRYLKKLLEVLGGEGMTGVLHDNMNTLLNVPAYPINDHQAMLDHGQEAIAELARHFHHFFKFGRRADGIESVEEMIPKLQLQWTCVMRAVRKDAYALKRKGLHTYQPSELIAHINLKLGHLYPELCFLLKVCVKVPLDTSCCERWISLLNRLKSKTRNRLSNTLLQNLMFICANGPANLKGLPVQAALKKWRAGQKRGRYQGKWKADHEAVVSYMARRFGVGDSDSD